MCLSRMSYVYPNLIIQELILVRSTNKQKCGHRRRSDRTQENTVNDATNVKFIEYSLCSLFRDRRMVT